MSFQPSFDRWAALAFASQFLIVFLVVTRAGMRPTWETFRPTVTGFVLAGLFLFRGARVGTVEVGSYVLLALYLANLARSVGLARRVSWGGIDWHTRWVIMAPLAILIVLLSCSILMDALPRQAAERVMEGMGLFVVVAAVGALVDPNGPAAPGLAWRKYGPALIPLGMIGLIATDDKRADSAFLGVSGLGICFLADVMIRGRTFEEKGRLAPLGLDLTHDGLRLNGAVDGVRLRFKYMDTYWDLEMETDAAPGPFLAATNAAIPLDVPLAGFLPGRAEIGAPPSWDGYRLFTDDAAAALASLEGAPAPRPIPRYLRRSGGSLFVHWEVPDEAVAVPEQFRLRLDAVSALARRWR